MTNRNRKNRKYVSTPAPKYPSISFIESYQNFVSRTVFRTKCLLLIEQKPTKLRARFQWLVPVCRLFSLTISLSLVLIRIRVDRSCGSERNVALESDKQIDTNWLNECWSGENQCTLQKMHFDCLLSQFLANGTVLHQEAMPFDFTDELLDVYLILHRS